jgi:hypothetical protein
MLLTATMLFTARRENNRMEKSEIKRLAEAIETGLRDGRTLEALRKAMKGSGYSDDDIREVIAHVDRKNIVRKPRQKKKEYPNYKTIAGLAVLVVVTMLIFFSGSGPTIPKPGEVTPPIANNTTVRPESRCYVVNESIKQSMINAGADCDKWFLINITEF